MLAVAKNREASLRTSTTSGRRGVGPVVDARFAGRAARVLVADLAAPGGEHHRREPLGVAAEVVEHVADRPAGQQRRAADLVVAEPGDVAPQPCVGVGTPGEVGLGNGGNIHLASLAAAAPRPGLSQNRRSGLLRRCNYAGVI